MRKATWLGWLGSVLGALSLTLLTAGATAVLTTATVRTAIAQEDDAPGGNVAGEAPTAPAAAQPVEPRGQSVLGWGLSSLGWGYSIIFLSLSLTLVALFVMNVVTASRGHVVPPPLVDGFQAHLNEKQYQDAYDLAKSDESFLGHVLSAGLAKVVQVGYGPAIEAMQEVGEEENMKLEHQLSYLSLIGTISPMIGLFGTVHGMIISFQVIATSPIQPKASELAGGISTALFTTLVGLFIAIPAIAAYNILRNRVARLVLEVGIVSEDLMSRFQNVGTKQTSPSSPSLKPSTKS